MGRRITRWVRWRTVLLVVLILLPGTPEVLSRLYAEQAARERTLAALAPGRNVLPQSEERHQVAPPSPSGAYPPYPLNHTFDADIVTHGAPTNHDFESPAIDVGTPPSNHNFSSGTYSSWTTTGSPTIGSDGTQGSYASLQASTVIETTNDYTPDGGMQYISFKVKGLSASTDKAIIEVLSGTGFTTVTQGWSGTAADSGWTTVKFFAQSFRGVQIKLKVRNNGGTIGVDDIGVQRAEIPGWTLPSTHSLVAGSPSGNAIHFDGSLTSSAVTFTEKVQQFTLRYRIPSSTGFKVELLRGGTFSTTTQITGGYINGGGGAWVTSTFPLGDYLGETVKIRLVTQLQAVEVDSVGVLQQALPGWTVSSDLPFGGVVPGVDDDGTYVTGTNGDLLLLSSSIDPGIVDTSGYVQGRSYVVRAAIGQGTNSMLVITWISPGIDEVLLSTAASSPTGVKNFRFTINENYGAPGQLSVKLTNGGRIYALGDNVARQQLSEPFSQPVGSGVDTSTGAFGTSETDLTIEGGPLPLVFTRYYHGHSDRFAEMGFRWSHTFDTFLGIYGSDVAVVFGSGKEEFFEEDGGDFTPIDSRVKSTLTLLDPPVNDVDYRYVTKDKLTYNFEGDGDLISIVDPNGNAIILHRDPTSELVTSIEDPGGRTLDLEYDGDDRLETVTGPDDAEVEYTYDDAGDLIAVDKPEDARTEYVYSRHRLIQIRQRQGEDIASAKMVTVLTNTLDDVNRVVSQPMPPSPPSGRG